MGHKQKAIIGFPCFGDAKQKHIRNTYNWRSQKLHCRMKSALRVKALVRNRASLLCRTGSDSGVQKATLVSPVIMAERDPELSCQRVAQLTLSSFIFPPGKYCLTWHCTSAAVLCPNAVNIKYVCPYIEGYDAKKVSHQRRTLSSSSFIGGFWRVHYTT